MFIFFAGPILPELTLGLARIYIIGPAGKTVLRNKIKNSAKPNIAIVAMSTIFHLLCFIELLAVQIIITIHNEPKVQKNISRIGAILFL